MPNYKYFIGIDISKDKLDLCVLEGKSVIWEDCIPNNPKALKAFGKKLQKMTITTQNALLCCEHTGVYAHQLTSWSSENGYKLWLEKAIQIKKSIGMQRGKNDKVDAYRIATYAFRYQDEAIIFERPRKALEELKHLSAARQRLLKEKKQQEVPLKELKSNTDKDIYKTLMACTRDALKGIKNSLKKIDARIAKIVKEDKKLAKSVKFATSVEGVGMITATSMLVATNEFKNVSSAKKLACYVGVAPFPHQSGSSVRGKNRVSHLANKPIKALLHMCAISARKNSAELCAYYERKIKEGKHAMSVINAIRNKLVQRIYVCVTQEKMYEKNFKNYLAKS